MSKNCIHVCLIHIGAKLSSKPLCNFNIGVLNANSGEVCKQGST